MDNLSRYKIATHSSPLALIHFNLRSRIVSMNARAEQVWSIPFVEAERKHCSQVCPLRTHAEQCRRCVIRLAVQDGKAHRQLRSGPTGDTYFYLGLPMRSPRENEINGSILAIEDLSVPLHYEKNLLSSLDLLKSLLSNLKEAVFIVADDGAILAVSEGEARRSGYGKRKLRAKNFIELFGPETGKEVRECLSAALQGSPSSPLTAGYGYAGGKRSVGHFRFFPLSGQARPSILVTMQDVAVQEKAHRERWLLKKAFDTSSDFLIALDSAGTMLHANRTAQTALQKSGKAMADRRVFSGTDFGGVMEDDPPSDDGPMREVFRTIKQAVKNTWRLKMVEAWDRREGRYGYVVTGEKIESISPGRGMKTDESAIPPRHPEYSAVLDAASVGIFIHDHLGMTYANKAFAFMLGQEPDRLLGKSFARLVNETHRGSVERYLDQVFVAEQAPQELKLECTLSCDGTGAVSSKVCMAPLSLDKKRVVVGNVTVVTDTSKEWEQRLSTTLRPRTGSIAAHVMREIGGPLQELYRAVECLQHTQLSSEQEETCRIFEQRLGHINLTIQHMIAATTVDHQGKGHIDFNRVAEEAINLTRLSLERRNIVLKSSLSPYVREVTASSHQMLQLFVVMINRAADDMARGGTLTIKSRKRGKKVIVEFSDTGSGKAEKEFPGFTGTLSGDARGAKIDMRMSYVMEIVSNHGGSINVRSVLGKGSRFFISLAICR